MGYFAFTAAMCSFHFVVPLILSQYCISNCSAIEAYTVSVVRSIPDLFLWYSLSVNSFSSSAFFATTSAQVIVQVLASLFSIAVLFESTPVNGLYASRNSASFVGSPRRTNA